MQEDDEEQRWIVVFACSTGNNTNTEERCVEIERRVRKRKQKQKMLFSLCHNIKTDIIMRITVHLFEGKVYACCVFFYLILFLVVVLTLLWNLCSFWEFWLLHSAKGDSILYGATFDCVVDARKTNFELSCCWCCFCCTAINSTDTRRIALESHKSGLFWLFYFLDTVDFSFHISSFEETMNRNDCELTSRRVFSAMAIVFW